MQKKLSNPYRDKLRRRLASLVAELHLEEGAYYTVASLLEEVLDSIESTAENREIVTAARRFLASEHIPIKGGTF